jgi:hypothetical protein
MDASELIRVAAPMGTIRHKAFGRNMGPHLEAVGMGSPDHLEHLWVEKLGWD